MIKVDVALFPLKKFTAIGPYLANQAAKGCLPVLGTYIPTQDGGGSVMLILLGETDEKAAAINVEGGKVPQPEKSGGNGATDRALPVPEVIQKGAEQ